jgi:monosaccharide ABC transporter ATP-binding protein, CUT2 family (TC 3.A.1.2.-)
VYQEIDLLPNLSVAENIMLGREPRRLGFIDWRATRLAAREAMRQVGLDWIRTRCWAVIRSRCSSWWRSRARSRPMSAS